MKLRSSLLVMTVSLALGSVGSSSGAKQRATAQHPKLLTVSSTQSVGNIDVLASRASRVSNKSDGSNGEVTTTPYITKVESG